MARTIGLIFPIKEEDKKVKKELPKEDKKTK